MSTIHKFYFDAVVKMQKAAREGHRLRYGQVMFNHLCEERPDLSEQVRATDKDPFYASSPMDERFDRFAEFIEKNWYKEGGGERIFILHWTNGDQTEIQGPTFQSAIRSSGYGAGAMSALDWWEEKK